MQNLCLSQASFVTLSGWFAKFLLLNSRFLTTFFDHFSDQFLDFLENLRHFWHFETFYAKQWHLSGWEHVWQNSKNGYFGVFLVVFLWLINEHVFSRVHGTKRSLVNLHWPLWHGVRVASSYGRWYTGGAWYPGNGWCSDVVLQWCTRGTGPGSTLYHHRVHYRVLHCTTTGFTTVSITAPPPGSLLCQSLVKHRVNHWDTPGIARF